MDMRSLTQRVRSAKRVQFAMSPFAGELSIASEEKKIFLKGK
jgi:hypothetical protein